MITYCTNIHPGESRDEIFRNLRAHVPAIKKAVSPSDAFPIGLRLSNQAALELDEETSKRFLEWCFMHNCYVPTINGFPYGSFHSSRIKENVYLPDWRFDERVQYTKRLASLLDYWLPAGLTGSVSTVPVGFKSHIAEYDFSLVRQNLLTVAEHLDRLKQKSGKEIILSLEPEPGCVLETTEEVVEFFAQMIFPAELREGIGICLDCCHQAIEFEDPSESLSLLSEADIKIGKVQVSSALSITNTDKETINKFSEPRYLHQVVIRQKDGNIRRYNDIKDALEIHEMQTEDEWRIHFHVPVFISSMDNYGTTRYFNEEVLRNVDTDTLLEVETYTWDVLPPELQTETVTESIIREIQWVKDRLP